MRGCTQCTYTSEPGMSLRCGTIRRFRGRTLNSVQIGARCKQEVVECYNMSDRVTDVRRMNKRGGALEATLVAAYPQDLNATPLRSRTQTGEIVNPMLLVTHMHALENPCLLEQQHTQEHT